MDSRTRSSVTIETTTWRTGVLRAPLEEGCEAKGQYGEEIHESSMAVAAAELPVPPARDQVRVEREDHGRRQEERARGATQHRQAGEGEQEERRPEKEPFLDAEEHAKQMRRREREPKGSIRADQKSAGCLIVDGQLRRDDHDRRRSHQHEKPPVISKEGERRARPSQTQSVERHDRQQDGVGVSRQEDQAGDDADHDGGALRRGRMPTLGQIDQRREQRKRVGVAVGRVVGCVVVEIRSKEERDDGEVRDAVGEVPLQHAPQDEESDDGPSQA